MKRLLLSLGLAAVLVGVALYRVGVEALLNTLGGVSLPLLGAALSIQVVILLIKAQRWAVALRAATGQAVRGTVTASLIGFAGNVVVPARLGEVLRAELVAQRNHLPRSLAVTTIAVTQFFDLLLLGLLFLLVSYAVATENLGSRWLPALIVAAGLAGLLLLIAVQRRRAGLGAAGARLAAVLPGPLRRASTYYAGQFASGLQLLGDRTAGGLVLLWTLAVWTLELVSMSLALAAFGIPLNLPATTALVVVLNLAFLMPITPANVGPHQLLSVVVLGLFGVAEGPALAFSLGLQGTCMSLVLLLGAVSLLRTGIGVRKLYGQVKATDRNKPALPEEYTSHADRTVPGFESPVQAARAGDPPRPAGGVRELHVHAGADRSGF